jgi:hypothetical protein
MAANRAAGAEARTISAQSVGLESKKTSGRGEVLFLDFPLYRTNQELARRNLPEPDFQVVVSKARNRAKLARALASSRFRYNTRTVGPPKKALHGQIVD